MTENNGGGGRGSRKRGGVEQGIRRDSRKQQEVGEGVTEGGGRAKDTQRCPETTRGGGRGDRVGE